MATQSNNKTQEGLKQSPIYQPEVLVLHTAVGALFNNECEDIPFPRTINAEASTVKEKWRAVTLSPAIKKKQYNQCITYMKILLTAFNLTP